MISEIAEGIFRVCIELPGNYLKKVNTYLIKGESRHLLIDTGLDLDCSEREMRSALAELGVSAENVDIFLTHSHSDHSGLSARLVSPGTRVYISHVARTLLENSSQPLVDNRQWGISPELFKGMKKGKVNDIPIPVRELLCYLRNGDVLEYGDHRLQFIETPGHSEDHACLFDEQSGLLFGGDLVLERVSSTVFETSITEGNLYKYFRSIKRVYDLDVRQICPAHGESFELRMRIRELQNLHIDRLRETFDAVKTAPGTAAEIAPKLRWHYGNGNWNDFPAVQKGFTIGAAVAYLDYLCYRSFVRAELCGDGVYRFSAIVEKLPDHIVDPL